MGMGRFNLVCDMFEKKFPITYHIAAGIVSFLLIALSAVVFVDLLTLFSSLFS
jgi:hypothetical protein